MKPLLKIDQDLVIIISFKARFITIRSSAKTVSNPFFNTIGSFKGNKGTKKYLHLIIDHFTRFAFISTLKTQVAKYLIKLTQKVEKMRTLKLY